MNNARHISKEINEVIDLLVGYGLSEYQQYSSQKNINGTIEIDWGNVCNVAISLKNIDYRQIYDEIDKNRDYNIKLLDGGIIQLMYKLSKDDLVSHRLAFFPSPYLESYQNEPDVYMLDEIYADIIYKNIVAFPIRFDYNKEEIESDFPHSKVHLTLGQYKNCRIPVYGPLSPSIFIEFILRNFYSSAYYKFLLNKFPKYCCNFYTIEKVERDDLHLNLEITKA